MDVLLQTQMLPCGSDTLESFWLPTSSSSLLQGSKPMVDYENANGDASFLLLPDKEETIGEDYYDGSCIPTAKKRRLTSNQVELLERNFKAENKLEPERKSKLAKELGLQPRQVAIWFQNRRARFKNKQLQKDYDSLKASYDKLKIDYDSLFKEKENLKTEVLALKHKLLATEKGKGSLEPLGFVNSSDGEPRSPIANDGPMNVSNEPLMTCKVEEASSAKSDVVDSDSPNRTDGNQCSYIEHAESSYVVEPDQGDFSQDEIGNLSKSLLQPPLFPKFELDCYYDHPPADSSHFGFTVEDQPFWSSPY